MSNHVDNPAAGNTAPAASIKGFTAKSNRHTEVGLKSDASITICGLVGVDCDIVARATPLIRH
jgi:hypothetical protein